MHKSFKLKNIIIDEYSLIGNYVHLYKLSQYKNLFDKNVNITIYHQKTIDDINHIYYNHNINIEYNENIIKTNINDIDLENILNFYGWYKLNDNEHYPKYDIIDPDIWITIHNDNDKPETMYFNDTNISYYNLHRQIGPQLGIHKNENIFYDYCRFDYDNDSIFEDLYNKNISIDALSTIDQIKKFYNNVIYEYDEHNNLIHIKRKTLNEHNILLETIFKFYGWYKKEDLKTLYPKYDIIDLKQYIKYKG